MTSPKSGVPPNATIALIRRVRTVRAWRASRSMAAMRSTLDSINVTSWCCGRPRGPHLTSSFGHRPFPEAAPGSVLRAADSSLT